MFLVESALGHDDMTLASKCEGGSVVAFGIHRQGRLQGEDDGERSARVSRGKDWIVMAAGPAPAPAPATFIDVHPWE